MRSLHWIIVALLVIALLALPAWYSMQGVGAQTIPSSEAKTLRASGNRTIIGGGSRLGK